MRIWWIKGASWETIHKSCFPSVWTPVSCGYCFSLPDFFPDTFTSSLLIHVFDCWETLWSCAKLFGSTTKESQIWECRSRLMFVIVHSPLICQSKQSTNHNLWTKKKEVTEHCLLHITPINHQCIQINHETPTEVTNNRRHTFTYSHCPDLNSHMMWHCQLRPALPFPVRLTKQEAAVWMRLHVELHVSVIILLYGLMTFYFYSAFCAL